MTHDLVAHKCDAEAHRAGAREEQEPHRHHQRLHDDAEVAADAA